MPLRGDLPGRGAVTESPDAGRAARVVRQAAAGVLDEADLPATLETIAEAAQRALRADRATCYVVSPDQVVSAVHTTERSARYRTFLEDAIGRGPDQLPLWRLHLERGEPVLVEEDTAELPNGLGERLGAGALLGVMLEHHSVQAAGAPHFLGSVFWSYRRPRRFSAADRATALGLSNLAALALANARLHAEASALAEEQGALGRVATAVAGGADPEAIFALVAEEVARLQGSDSGLVARFESDHAVTVGHWGSGPIDLSRRVPLSSEGSLGQVARTGRPARVADYASLAEDPVGSLAVAAGYSSSVSAPVRVEGRLWGAVAAAVALPGWIPDGAERRLAHFADLVGLAIAQAESRAQLAAQAASDPLTGLANQRNFHERLHAEVGRAQRHGGPLSLVLLDLDHFKRVNEQHGHEVGDRMLTEVASRLSRLVRPEDVLARLEGGAFAWILPESDGLEAWSAGERARTAIADVQVDDVPRQTISAGVCELGEDGSASELFRLADTALYWAKVSGRDMCCRYSPERDAIAAASVPRRGPRQVATSVDRLLALAREQLGMDVAVVGEFVEDRQVCRHLEGSSAPFGLRLGASRPLHQTHCQGVAEGWLPSLVSDVRTDRRAERLRRVPSPGAYIGVPIDLAGGRRYGTLFCMSRRPRTALRERDVSFLRVLAAMLSEQLVEHEVDLVGQAVQLDRINRALETGQPTMVFQPIVDLRTGAVVAVEALARFAEEGGRPPDVWFGEAAAVGLGVELELGACRAALAQLGGLPALARLSVNLSPETLRSPELLALLDEFPGERLAVELTEHAPVEDYEALRAALAQLRERRVQVMIDDAGAGFSSLRHVLGLAPDMIKLDVSLTRDIDADPLRRALAASLVSFAAEIPARIVAEGIETHGELAALRTLGIAYGQGYYLGGPGPLPLHASPARMRQTAPRELGSPQGAREP